MNSTQLECFMQVAENLNFARAAEALHITQPSVTHQIHTLEAELNVKLFHRTTRSVSLTQAGLSFFSDAKNILSLMKISKMRLHDDSADKLSFFAMGFHSRMELAFLPGIIKEMKRQVPLLHPIIKMVPFHALANLLADETIDVMFEFKPINSASAISSSSKRPLPVSCQRTILSQDSHLYLRTSLKSSALCSASRQCRFFLIFRLFSRKRRPISRRQIPIFLKILTRPVPW